MEDEPFGIEFFNRIQKLRFNEARRLDQSWRSTVREVQNDAVREAAEWFFTNLHRLDTMAVLPFMLVRHAVWGQQLVERAKAGNFLQLITGTLPDDDKDQSDAILQAMSERMDEGVFPTAGRIDGLIELLIGHQWHYVSEGFHSLLSSQLLLAWTAYEALATDLWVAAVNSRPHSLGRNAWFAERKNHADGGRDADGNLADSRSVHWDVLAEKEFDLSKCLGDLMWEKRRFDFNSLEGLETAYTSAFRHSRKDGKTYVDPKVKPWFEGDGRKELNILHALRHVIVHRGGKADGRFISRVKNTDAFRGLKDTDSIELNGPLVADCTMACIRCGVRLLTGVDQWLTENPK
ncbi:MAG: hypothetical protein WBC44_05540 [Planctomycetaceae bacterium]